MSDRPFNEQRQEAFAANTPVNNTIEDDPPPGAQQGQGVPDDVDLNYFNEFPEAADHSVDLLVGQFPASQTGISRSTISGVVGENAWRFYERNQYWPTPAELLEGTSVLNVLSGMEGGSYTAFPSLFFVEQEDGTLSQYANDPIDGLRVVIEDVPRRGPLEGLYGVGPVEAEAFTPRRGPTYTFEQFQSILNRFKPPARGQRAPTLDPALLEERATEQWRELMLNEPPNARALVDKYLKAYRSFYKSGGRLDFDTFILGEIRKAPGYSSLYGDRPESVSEREWINRYRSQTARLGLREAEQVRQIRAGASGGVSEAGFAERLSTLGQRGSEAFTRRLAALVNQSGVSRT